MSRLAPLTLEQFRTAYRFDVASQRYRLLRSGHYVARTSIKRILLDVVDGTKADLRRLASQMAEGAIEIGAWQRETARVLKSLHLAAHAAARGGFHALTAADYGRLGNTLKFVYGRLSAFALDVEQGRLTGPQIEARAALYGAHANGTFENGRRYGAGVAGYTEERRVLGAAEHCADCVQFALMKWQPIGTLPDIGTDAICRSNCRCSFVFR